jgi:hypothetical protein
MDKQTNELLTGLENELRTLEEQIKYWQDPRIIGLGNISGSRKSPQEISTLLVARMAEIRKLIESVSK